MSSLSLNIVSDEYKENLALLISKINNGNVIAFLGAGLSVEYGYRSWKTLVGVIKDERPSLISLANLNEDEWKYLKLPNGDFDLLKIAEKCYNILGSEKWNAFVSTEYSNLDNIDPKLSDPYVQIFRSNFQSFVTTNFDGCAFKIATVFIKNLGIRVYPKNMGRVIQRALHHIHGAGFNIIQYYTPEIVLTESQYEAAYQRNVHMMEHFNSYLKYDLAFFGFSMNDQHIIKMLDLIDYTRKRDIQSNPERPIEYFNKERFIILPYKSDRREFDVSIQKKTLKKIIQEDDEYFQQRNIKVIRYLPNGEDYYSQFKKLTEYIMINATYPDYISNATAVSLDELGGSRD
jgi:hypothetical protein